uniref:Uncharacterized protein n=1 Tax=Glossina brevipalpis TaxID=37001 RepID=A0A1A9WR70_9MUSC
MYKKLSFLLSSLGYCFITYNYLSQLFGIESLRFHPFFVCLFSAQKVQLLKKRLIFQERKSSESVLLYVKRRVSVSNRKEKTTTSFGKRLKSPRKSHHRISQ